VNQYICEKKKKKRLHSVGVAGYHFCN